MFPYEIDTFMTLPLPQQFLVSAWTPR